MATFTYQLQGHEARIEAFDVVADGLRHDPTYTEVISEDEAEKLKGDELTEALERAHLPKSGTAAEKRRRLAEATAPTSSDEGPDAPAFDPAKITPTANVDRDAAHQEEN